MSTPGSTPGMSFGTPGGGTPSGSGSLAAASGIRRFVRLPPEVERILYIRNLPFKISAEELFDIFGKYGPIRQVRKGNTAETRGTAFVVYDDVYDAKAALDGLSGFNVDGRYLVILYYNKRARDKRSVVEAKKEENELLKKMYGAGVGAASK